MKTDVTNHFDVFGSFARLRTPIEVELTGNMYEPGESARDHWLRPVFQGFDNVSRTYLRPRGRGRPEVFWSVGSSSGLDALGAWEAFYPRRLVITDIVPGILDVARRNVQTNAIGLRPSCLTTRQGDLAEPIASLGLKVDIAYANLPILPVDKTQAEIVSEPMLAASAYPSARLAAAPALVQESLLELYYSFLKQTRDLLAEDGVVLCVLGGRVSWNAIEGVFRAAGFKATLVRFDFKPQEQPETCLPLFSMAERKEREFSFFAPYRAASNSMHSLRVGEQWSGAPHLRNEALSRLESYRISATQAVALMKAGRRVGHLVYFVMGQRA